MKIELSEDSSTSTITIWDQLLNCGCDIGSQYSSNIEWIIHLQCDLFASNRRTSEHECQAA